MQIKNFLTWAPAWLGILLMAACGSGGNPAPDIFSVPTTYPVGKKPSAIVAQDMNQDGYPDLLVVNSQSNDLYYYEGRGDGTFKKVVILETGREPMALAAADFNGDAIPDIAVCNYGDGNISIILGQKDGVFKLKQPVKAGRLPISITSGDFNNDEITDLAVTLRFDKLLILLGIGDGRFKLAESYRANGTPSHIVAGDYNRDKNLDLAVSFNAVKASFIRVFSGNGDGTFQPPRKFKGGHQSSFINQADLNGDGALDLIVSSFGLDSVTLFLGDGKGGFDKMPDVAGEKGPEFVVAGEFTSDRFPDLVVCNRRDGSISILEGNGDGSFKFPHFNYAVGRQPRAMTAADFNRDGRTDLALVLYQAAVVSVYIQNTGIPDDREG